MSAVMRAVMRMAIPPARPRRSPTRARGLTLVELMVGMAVGLFLVTVTASIFLGSKGTFTSQGHVARLQESARFAADQLATDLRMAGFRGCRGSGGATALATTLRQPTDFQINFAQGVWAARHTGSTWVPALDSTLRSPSLSPEPDPAGEVLTVRRPVGTGWALTAEMLDGRAPLSITPTADIRRGDLLMVSDCAGAAVLQATNATPGTDGAIEHSATVSITPGLSTDDLGRPFLQDALVHRLATTTYYLAESRRPGKAGLRALWSFTSPAYDGTPQPQELVTGVEDLAVQLGMDSNGDGTVDAYVRPDQVVNWAQVQTASVSLLLVSLDDRVTTVPQPITFDGALRQPTDRRMRTVISTTASVRNSVR